MTTYKNVWESDGYLHEYTIVDGVRVSEKIIYAAGNLYEGRNVDTSTSSSSGRTSAYRRAAKSPLLMGMKAANFYCICKFAEVNSNENFLL